MSKSRFLIIGCIAFAGGVCAASVIVIPARPLWACLAVLLVLVPLFWSFPKFRIFAGIVACIAIGMLRMNAAHKPNSFGEYIGTKGDFDGVISADVDVRPTKQQLTFKPDGYDQSMLIVTSKYAEYSYGDRLWVQGKPTIAKPSDNFDYGAYLKRYNIYALLSYPKIIVLKTGQGNFVVRNLLGIKYIFIRQISKVLPEIESNLLLGILIGARKGLPDEVIQNFNSTGVSHVIAISGYNISIIASALGFLDYYLGRRWNAILVGALIMAFVIVSGASSSVMRAALMGGLVLLSGRVGRSYAITPSLCLAATVMLSLNPRILVWDASFQLSFLATMGVVYIAPVVQFHTESWPKLFGVKDTLFTTLSAIASTLPYMLLQFGRLSLIAPIINIMILPLVPMTMLFGFLTALPIVGAGFGLIAQWLLQYMLWLTAYGAGMKFSSVPLYIGPAMCGIMYCALIGYYYLMRPKPAWRQQDSVIK